MLPDNDAQIVSVRFRYHFMSESVLVFYQRADHTQTIQRFTELESRLLIQQLLDRGFEVEMENSEIILRRTAQDGSKVD